MHEVHAQVKKYQEHDFLPCHDVLKPPELDLLFVLSSQ